MGRKEQVRRNAEEKWEILQEGLRSGNIAETCGKHGGATSTNACRRTIGAHAA